jgi:uncharacterized protein
MPDVSARQLTFGGSAFIAAGDAALFWPKHRMLLVADLHLEKGSSYARGGQMLPPYDSLATLEGLARLIAQSAAAAVTCLGDNFHDNNGEQRLCGAAADLLRQLTGQVQWTWITGNHDPAIEAKWGGTTYKVMELDNIHLRHEAQAMSSDLEISGHYHPKLRVAINGRHIQRRCYIKSDRKLIMPAFGSLTGGMDASEAALIAQPDLRAFGAAHAVVSLPHRLARFPLNLSDRKKRASAS